MFHSSRLAENIPQAVRDICARLAQAGHRSWVVGGSVRDELLAELEGTDTGARADWDIATEARPEQVTRLFRRVIPTGLQHGTVTIVTGGQNYEVTTLRGEAGYSDGRHPDEVRFVSDIAEDLARRDFTINAMAYDPSSEQLVDPYGGAIDLKARILRAVGDPVERFSEDGLRVLRAARFAATLEVELDPATEQAIAQTLDTFRKVSPERVRDEWLKAMKAKRPSRAFEIMREHGLLKITAPEMMESVGCEQNHYHAYDVWGHAMSCLDHCAPEPVLRIAALLHDVGKPRSRAFSDKTQDYTFYEHERIGAEMAQPMLERLRFSNHDRDKIVALVRHHLICYDEKWSDAAVRRWLKRVSPELVESLYALNRADVLGKGKDATEDLERLSGLQQRVKQVLEQGAAFTVRDLAINGRDLMKELDLQPGPVLGETLRELLEAVIENPETNERERLLDLSRDLLAKRASD